MTFAVCRRAEKSRASNTSQCLTLVTVFFFFIRLPRPLQHCGKLGGVGVVGELGEGLGAAETEQTPHFARF